MLRYRQIPQRERLHSWSTFCTLRRSAMKRALTCPWTGIENNQDQAPCSNRPKNSDTIARGGWNTKAVLHRCSRCGPYLLGCLPNAEVLTPSLFRCLSAFRGNWIGERIWKRRTTLSRTENCRTARSFLLRRRALWGSVHQSFDDEALQIGYKTSCDSGISVTAPSTLSAEVVTLLFWDARSHRDTGHESARRVRSPKWRWHNGKYCRRRRFCIANAESECRQPHAIRWGRGQEVITSRVSGSFHGMPNHQQAILSDSTNSRRSHTPFAKQWSLSLWNGQS